MTAADQIKLVCGLGPVLGLLVLGLFIVLRNGIASLGTGHGVRELAEDVTRTIVWLGGCVLGLAVLQQVIGSPMAPPW